MRRAAALALLLGACRPAAPTPVADPASVSDPVSASASGSASASEPASASDPEPASAWASLRAILPGSWSVSADGGAPFPVSFSTASRDSVLVETFGPPGRQTLTTYVLDGHDVLATHYCAQGNQPRLRATAGASADVTFRIADITGLDPDEAHLVELTLRDLTPDAFTRVETYAAPDGTTEVTTYAFRRTPATPAPAQPPGAI